MSDAEYRFTVRPLSEDEGGDQVTKRCWMAAVKEAGRRTPPPSVEPAKGYSRKWQIRAPKSSHRRLAERAKCERGRHNTLAVTMLAEGLGGLSVHGH